MNDIQMKQLMQLALDTREKAYAPYSHFLVGAALLGKDGRMFGGCNIENASFGATQCAERTAYGKAVSEGCRQFEAIAICGGEEGAELRDQCPPCGICRQFMAEFGDKDFQVILFKDTEHYTVYSLDQVMPLIFNL